MDGRRSAVPGRGGLRRGLGAWHGRMPLGPFRDVRLVVEGGLLRPCPGAVAASAELPARGGALMRAAAEAARTRLRAWALDGTPLAPVPDDADGMWDLMEPVHVVVRGGRGPARIEIGMRVAWDEEHLWGAGFADWSLVWLSESVAGR